MAENSEERKVKIIVDSMQANASIKEMAAGAAIMNSQLAKMSQDDPRRAQLQDDFARLTARIKETSTELRTVKKSAEELAAEEQKLAEQTAAVAAQQEAAVESGKRQSASMREMKDAAGILGKQLEEMSAEDPGRAALLRDYQVLEQRLKAAGSEMRTYQKTAEELAEDERKLAQETEDLARANEHVILNGQKVNASLKDMKQSAGLLEKQLHELAADDPARAKMLADYQALEHRIDGVNKELKGLKPGLLEAAEGGSFFKTTMASALGVFTGGGALELAGQAFGFLKEAKEDFESSAQAGAQLEATLKSTGNAAGVTQQQIEDLATARMGLTLFDDDDTKASASLLLTFTAIKDGVFQEAMPAIQDLAQKMAGDGPADLKGASIQVGKALNDPIKGITALSRVGVSFTEEQKKVIEQLVATGDTAGAQRIILGELNKEFGGSAEAARKAAGPLGTLKMVFADTKETIGGFVVDGLSKATDWLGRLWDKTEPVRDIFVDLWQEGTRLYDNLYDVAESLGLVAAKGDGTGLAAKLLIGLFTILTAGMRSTVAVANALVDGFVNLYNKSEVFRGVVGGLVETFKNIAKSAWDTLGGVGDLLVGIFTLDVDKIKAGLKETFASTGELIYNSGMGAAENFYKGYNAAKDTRIVRKVKAEETSSGGGMSAMPASNGEEGDSSQAEAAAAKLAKAEEAAARQRQAARNKADQERLNNLKQWVKDEGDMLQSRSALHARLDGQALTDEMMRRELQRQKLFEDATQKAEQLTGQELDYTERVKAIMEERDLALRELTAKFAEEDLKEKQQVLDQKIAGEEASAAERVAKLELDLANGVLDEQAFQDAVFLVKQTAAARELEFIKQKYGAESVEAKKKNAEILKGQAEHIEKTKGLDAGMLKFEQGLAAAKKVLGSEEVTMLGELFGKKSLVYKATLAAQKALAIAEIGIGLQKQIAANSEAGAKISASAPPFTVPLGVAYTIGTNALALVSAGVSAAKIAGFREGGRTVATGGKSLLDSSQFSVSGGGQLLDQEGFVVAGVVHENEYVIPQWMRADPKVVQVEEWLEAKRLRGYAAGGATSDGSSPVPVAGEGSGSDESVLLLRQLVEEQRRQNERMDTWAREFQVVQKLHDFDKEYKTYKEVSQDSGISG
ncbi:hypothetical protein [uncultured Hymenobacter sp.]|uniref:hypothetical protein n=1 Tax=uncultured Hymenobacter sp. TaxID=170016 RepID=UPI0035CA597C